MPMGDFVRDIVAHVMGDFMRDIVAHDMEDFMRDITIHGITYCEAWWATWFRE